MLANKVQKWIEEGLLSSKTPLELGAGGIKRCSKITTVDFLPYHHPDYLWDLNKYPWPLPDNYYDYVILSNILEHIVHIVPFMQELHRICTPSANIRIVSPHFSNPFSFADPTHHHFFLYLL